MTMLAAMLLAATFQASPPTISATPADSPDPVLARLVALYDEVCIQSFPIDGAIDKLMVDKHAIALTPEQVKVTLVDDPGRGWIVKDGLRDTIVMLELPPYHACSVRRFVSNPLAEVSPYRFVVDRFEAGHPGFVAAPPRDRDHGNIHLHALLDGRVLPGGTVESLMFIEQTTTDPMKPAAGVESIEYRFVHQIRSAP